MDYVNLAWLDPLPYVTAIDMVIHGRGCGHTSVELHVVASAKVYNSFSNLFI